MCHNPRPLQRGHRIGPCPRLICALLLVLGPAACADDSDDGPITLTVVGGSGGSKTNDVVDGDAAAAPDVTTLDGAREHAADAATTGDLEGASDLSVSGVDAAEHGDSTATDTILPGGPDAGDLDAASADVDEEDAAIADAVIDDAEDDASVDAAAVDGVAVDVVGGDAIGADVVGGDAVGGDAAAIDVTAPDSAPDDVGAGADSGTCTPAGKEVCDGVDNDCDGKTDESICDDDNECTTGFCQAEAATGAWGCVQQAKPGPCSDGDLCTDGDACADGKCVGGKVFACDDGLPCTKDTCTMATGCSNVPIPGSGAAPCGAGQAWGTSCYAPAKQSSNWTEAEAACVVWGGHLVSIGSAAENGHVLSRIKAVCGNTPAWIGANDKAVEKVWTWTDGSPFTYSNWGVTEPNDFFGEDVAWMSPSGKWVDIDEKGKASCRVCERPAPAACNDANACTHSDTCDAKGKCNGKTLSCDDGNACTADSCAPAKGCQHVNAKDGAACGGGGKCAAGVCKAGTPDLPAASCLAVQKANPKAVSAIYWLDPDGAGKGGKFKAWCDMKNSGGGWTLIMKVNGGAKTFGYDSYLWTNKAGHNAHLPGFDGKEAKLPGYWSVPFTKLRLGMRVGSSWHWIELPWKAPSLLSVMQNGKYKATKLGRNTWKSLISGSSLQKHCNREGFNVYDNDARVRIGIVANNEKDCKTPDSRIGFGGAGKTCGQDHYNTCGNTARCGGDKGNKNTKAFGYIFVR